MKNRRKAVQPFEIKKRKIDISRNYEANGFEKNQRKFENFSTLISKKSTLTVLQTQALTISGHYYLEFVKEPCSIKTALLKRHGNIIVDRQIVGG